jgi:hypothetical protein
MYRSAVYERSPYLVVEGDPACGCWSWATVLDALRRSDEGEVAPAELPEDVKRAGASIGLAVGLGFRQLALLYEDVHYSGWTLPIAA